MFGYGGSDGVRIESPFHTVDFLEESQEILKSRFTALTVDDCVDSAGTLLSATASNQLLHEMVEFLPFRSSYILNLLKQSEICK